MLVENFKVGGLKGYGLDYDSLKAINPRLIYCSITGFGQTGPYAPRAGYDLLIQASSGMMSITGRPDGEPGGGGMRVGVAITDVFTGIYASTAILAAVQRAPRHRPRPAHRHGLAGRRHGRARQPGLGLPQYRRGAAAARATAIPASCPTRTFPPPTARCCLPSATTASSRASARPPATRNGRAIRASAATRRAWRNRETLVPLMEAVTRTRTTAQWVESLGPLGVPCGPINDIAQAFADPQVAARGLVLEPGDCARQRGAAIRGVASPLRLSRATRRALRNAPPALGEHTEAVLAEFGRYARQRSRNCARAA